VAAAFAVGVVLAARRGRKSNYRIAWIWLAVAGLPPVLAGDIVPHALRSLLMTPAVFLLAALGAQQAWSMVRAPRLRAAAVVVAALWLAWEPYHTYFEVWAKNPNVPPAFDADVTEVARQVRADPGRATVLVPRSNWILAQPVIFLAGRDGIRYELADVDRVQLAATEPRP
jgi:hypothetical protein